MLYYVSLVMSRVLILCWVSFFNGPPLLIVLDCQVKILQVKAIEFHRISLKVIQLLLVLCINIC